MTEQVIKYDINEDYYIEMTKHKGTNGDYYCINGTNYDIHFPIDWIFKSPENIDNFGPEECNLCAEYGYYNGVFIGYCLHCAKNANFERGNGMIRYGMEVTHPEAKELDIPIEYDDKNSIWNNYMQFVDMNEIGDIKLSQKHGECFKYNKIINGKEVKEGFDFYKWLNMSGMCYYISSDDEDTNDDIFTKLNNNLMEQKKYKNLSLIYPEPEV
jgi:hypothetical protein